ncbi:MAG: hypothetical protein ACI4NU_05700 [Christensenellales bacterium]
MCKRKYQIQMRTPLGNRTGTLEVQIEKNIIKGHLDVLKHLEPFEGNIDENGHCSINGRLVTLMSAIPYTATGQITPDSLHLSLKGGRNLFPITGTVCQENGTNVPAEAVKERECL